MTREGFAYEPDEYVLWPYNIPQEDNVVPMEHERIPPGEIAAHRGMSVEATNGHIGQVDEFLIDPLNGHITHLIMRKGHLWGRKDVTIPVSEIKDVEEDMVTLKLSREQIEALPSIPLRLR